MRGQNRVAWLPIAWPGRRRNLGGEGISERCARVPIDKSELNLDRVLVVHIEDEAQYQVGVERGGVSRAPQLIPSNAAEGKQLSLQPNLIAQDYPIQHHHQHSWAPAP